MYSESRKVACSSADLLSPKGIVLVRLQTYPASVYASLRHLRRTKVPCFVLTEIKGVKRYLRGSDWRTSQSATLWRYTIRGRYAKGVIACPWRLAANSKEGSDFKGPRVMTLEPDSAYEFFTATQKLYHEASVNQVVKR